MGPSVHPQSSSGGPDPESLYLLNLKVCETRQLMTPFDPHIAAH